MDDVIVDQRDFGRLEAEVEHLRQELKEHKDESKRALIALGVKIDGLVELANQGKGSLRTLLMSAGAVGAVVGWFADWFIKR